MGGSTLYLFKAGFYPVYVLTLLLTAYLLNQLDRYALAITSQPMAREIKFGDKGCLPYNNSLSLSFKTFCVKSHTDKDKTERNRTACITKGLIYHNNSQTCVWDYDGTGEQYQILAGPVFIVVYTLSGVVLGLFTGTFNRKNILIFCLLLWSLMTLLTGFAKKYWHLLLARFVLGIGEAGCTPFATSLIADYFSENLRGAALGVYNWGIYIGYSMAFAFGNYITNANINAQGWRWVFFIAAIPGFVVGLLMIFTVKEPEKKEGQNFEFSKLVALKVKLLIMLKTFLRPSLILLFIAGSIRNAGGYVWAYNTQPYFNKYYPETDVGKYMSWIPLVGGSLGVVFGGFISDRLVKNRGSYARIWVLVVSQVFAAPFAAGALFLKPPWAFISLIPSNIIGEMWVGVTLAVVVELVPSSIRTASVAYYLFIISVIGGNVPLLVPVIKSSLGLRNSLYILFPGLYLLSSVLFLITLFVIKRDLQRAVNISSVTSPLLPDSNTNEESEKLLSS